MNEAITKGGGKSKGVGRLVADRRRDVIGRLGVRRKASVPLGQSHINSWGPCSQERAAAGSFAARDTRALTCNVYLSFSLSLSRFAKAGRPRRGCLRLFLPASCSYLSPRGALEIIIPVRLLKAPVSRSLNVYRVFRYSSTSTLPSLSAPRRRRFLAGNI